jgi:UDP:flavonoid glycosyltransferase YjiC (YdhE family)
LELIARSSAIISHAGLNTTMDALAAGKPIVAIPITDDQPGVAARIVRSGAGIKLSYRALSATAVSRALGAVLNGFAYRAAAERMAKVLRSLSGPDIAVSVIERTLGS